MEYKFRDIEKKWQKEWSASGIYNVSNNSSKPKYYVLDMFPYPSGAGLHVGHPLGYIASDIYARYKRLKGFNVLHPMGYDSFGLPAEQYAIETGQHPALTTEKNISTFRNQLDSIGFCYDWSRELKTSDPTYYKWTQWIFLELFNSWFDRKLKKARHIRELIEIFEANGNVADNGQRNIEQTFSASEWNQFIEEKKLEVLMNFRLAFSAYGEVNWCPFLGTVLANDEVINGFSERGGYPVEKKKMRQWYLRITDYADRLLEGLQNVEFSEAMKDIQRNWIGKSEGAEIEFNIKNTDLKLKVFTTRPETIFGVDFMVLAPEHYLVEHIVEEGYKEKINNYLIYVNKRSERERLSDIKFISGAFTGAYAINPFSGREISIWISEYVLVGYGTGAIMGVPCGDQRDFNFARHFNLPITNIIGEFYNGNEANSTKEAILTNSGFLDGMLMEDAIEVIFNEMVDLGVGEKKVNYKMRDAGFSRQRYWGEPFPIVYKNGIAYGVNSNELPVLLPHVENYKPGPEGEGPLSNLSKWKNLSTGIIRETNTMPGYAGSSWYFLRYMDPHNDSVFTGKNASDYWNQVDVYVGGTEHAVGHLLYSRMWTKVLFDLGYISFDEPFKKLVNQGMIQGSSRFVYRVTGTNEFVTYSKKDNYNTDKLHVDICLVDGINLDINAFKTWKPEFADATFILENDKYICGVETEKMSKSKFNTVNPNDIIEKYGADTFRMYEMFLGPIDQSKPWDTKGIEGVHRFLKKFWRLFVNDSGGICTDDEPELVELKVLHKTIKKIEEDTEKFSFNTAVSAFMVCVNELTELSCHKKLILEKLLILLTPFAPHISEELWKAIGNDGSILNADFPILNKEYLIEYYKDYPISINGKMRTSINISLSALEEDVNKLVLENEIVIKWLNGKQAKKIIFVKGKMVNIVV